MKKILLLVNCWFLCLQTIKSQTIDWVQTIHYLSYTQAIGVAIDNNGNSYVGGSYEGSYRSGVFVAKFSPTGNLLWADTSGAQHLTKSAGIVIDKFSNVYTAVHVENGILTIGGISYGSFSMYLIKYNSNGQIQWVVKGNNYSVRAMTIDKQGYVYVLGGGKISKYDSNGNCLLSVGTSGGQDLEVDGFGNIYVDGSWKYSPSGNLLWTFSNSGKIGVDSTGNSYISDMGFYGNSTLIKVSPSGQGKWGVPVPYEGGYSVYCDNMANAYVYGIYTVSQSPLGMSLAKYDSIGNILSYLQIPFSSYCPKPNSVTKSSNNIYLTCYEGYSGDAFLYKLSEPITTNIKTTQKESKNLVISPNPTRDIFSVSYKKENTHCSLILRVCDVNGKCVYSKGFKEFKGELTETIDLSGLAKGTYLVEIIGGDCKESKKLILQ